MNGIEKMIEEGLEILPFWSGKNATLIIRKNGNEEFISCIHSVIYKGSVEGIPSEISTEKIQKEELPSLKVRKFALRSFCQSVCELYPSSLSPEMVGPHLSYQLNRAIRRVSKSREAFLEVEIEAAHNQALLIEYGKYIVPSVHSPRVIVIRLYMLSKFNKNSNIYKCYNQIKKILNPLSTILIVPSPRRDFKKASYREWTIVYKSKKVGCYIEWLNFCPT